MFAGERVIDRGGVWAVDVSVCGVKSAAIRRSEGGSQSTSCDVYVGGKVRVSEFMIFLALQHCGSK